MTKKHVDIEAGVITFTFDDETVQSCVIANIPEATRVRALFHGISQKVGDSYASASQADDPLAYAKAACRETIAQLYAGDWRAASTAGPRVTDLAVALSRLTGKSIEEADAFVDGLDDDQKKVWRAKAKVKAMLAQIAAEKAAAKAAKLSGKADEEEISLA